MTTKDIRMLCEYNGWANASVLGAASNLSDEQFVAPRAFPHGGLRGTLVHALFAEWTWRMRWLGTPPPYGYRFKLEDFPTVAALRARWTTEEAALMDFVGRLTDQTLTTELEYTSTEGGRHRRVLWETMTHLVNHGTQHRSEAAAMLTALGHSPGDLDLIVYLNERSG
jgi:uncharacterized damage-inducible protein DinB